MERVYLVYSLNKVKAGSTKGTSAPITKFLPPSAVHMLLLLLLVLVQSKIFQRVLQLLSMEDILQTSMATGNKSSSQWVLYGGITAEPKPVAGQISTHSTHIQISTPKILTSNSSISQGMDSRTFLSPKIKFLYGINRLRNMGMVRNIEFHWSLMKTKIRKSFSQTQRTQFIWRICLGMD